MDRSTGEIKIKIKQLLTPPRHDFRSRIDLGSGAMANSSTVKSSREPTTIQVCQGSSCRRKGSEQICRSMQAYLDRQDLTQQVEIATVKCLHQCKAAPHAIVTSPVDNQLPGKTHYRQLHPRQIPTLLAKHFSNITPAQPQPMGANLIEKIGDYLHQQIISTSHPFS